MALLSKIDSFTNEKRQFMSIEEKFSTLKESLGDIADLRHSAALLSWDQDTYMPPGGTAGRSSQLSTLQRIAHERFTSDAMGELLTDLEPWAAQLDPSTDDAALVRKVRRDYDRLRKVPAEFVARHARTCSQATDVWVGARKASDFALFAPWLSQIMEQVREYADHVGYDEHPYDALLDGYEPGMKASQVEAIFTPLRQETIPIVRAIQDAQPISTECLRGDFDPQIQLALGREMVAAFGYDFNRGRVDLVAHPYCTHFGRDDVRITTTVNPHQFSPNFFGMLHECGHALYEQGSGENLERTPLAGGVSLGLHESQSRMWENLVGRSRPFWKWAYPTVQQHFPHLQSVPLQTFYQAINQVQPSLIRVEADEVTYNLHVMLRFELEKALLDGQIQVADLPELWNSRMQEYLGVTPPNDAQGVLQDVHWSIGLVGYFPTYSLGNILSVQLFEAAKAAHPDLEEGFARGEFEPLLRWNREQIHVHGSKFDPVDLVRQATGRELDAAPYVAYLRRKVKDVYGISL